MTEIRSPPKKAGNKNSHFFEDFSTTAIGKNPIGWYANSQQWQFTVTLEVQDSNWALMKGNNSLIPNQLKKPLPQDFTLSYELIAAQNFTWGAKGLTFQLSTATSTGNTASYLQLRLRPGFNGSDGEAGIQTRFPSAPGLLKRHQMAESSGFFQ